MTNHLTRSTCACNGLACVEPVEGSFGDADRIPFPKTIRHHPVVGFGRIVKPASSTQKLTYSPFEAFQEICFSAATTVDIPGDDGALMTARLTPGCVWQETVADRWNWRPKDIRQFVSDLREYSLIDDSLLAAMLRIVPVRQGRRDALRRSTRAAVLAKTGGKCFYCGVSLAVRGSGATKYHCDHAFPLVRGGSDDPANLLPACAKCNGRKGSKTLAELIGWSADNEA